ncbi:ADC synthase [Microdochium bolleyi]|uniref:aminodeoxychorismate synthase n=1 Tax=Microdochium bolleyi TaxID=196109 RepID=A0A136J7Q7_9PEZI|nr:ADC synthase [Microdochium bolleyi]
MHTPQPRILFLDAYDSFSNNIVSLLADVLSAQVDILPIDAALPDLGHHQATSNGQEQLRCLVAHYDAVVCGPGPGSPTCDQDVGLMKHVWTLSEDHVLPVLGICLGFQSLVIHCGGVVRKLSTGLHGMIRDIDHVENQRPLAEGNIFAGVPKFKATLYHSLFADISSPEDGTSGAKGDWARSRWNRPAHLPDILPLAWVTEHRASGFDERILMGVKHARRPFWGLQYHPESICTESTGHQVIRNWFAEALRWNEERGRRRTTAEPDVSLKKLMCNLPKKSESLSRQFVPLASTESPSSLWEHSLGCKYYSRTLRLPNHVEVPDIVESLQAGRRDFIVLDSASAKTSRTGLDVKGRYSIIALDVDETLQLEYRTGSRRLTLRRGGERRDGHGKSDIDLEQVLHFDGEHTIWNILAAFWSKRQLPREDGNRDNNITHPFYGGFMGLTTYELGLEGIDVEPLNRRDGAHDRPDLSFAWVTRSAVMDHMEGTICLQTLSPDGPIVAGVWLDQTVEALTSSPVWADGLGADFSIRGGGQDQLLAAATAQLTPPLTPETTRSAQTTTYIQIPDADDYEDKVRECQEHIAAGDSYELCLTDQTLITRPRSHDDARLASASRHRHNSRQAQPGTWHSTQQKHVQQQQATTETSWSLYRALRARNPAPFGSYIRLGGATLVSSSPERFLEFSGATGLCSMRPMKGTVKKSSAVATLAQAEQILHVPKEEAENLMIVDLVRHDLHSVCGTGETAVRVPQLLKVEEYASVFQMISVVEGQLPLHASPSASGVGKEQQQHRVTGLDVLAATLPPGSMTGAPKKRSCELLQHIERGASSERSLYSGVVGYMDVRGNGDWSVTIRSLFRWDDEVVLAPSSTAAATAPAARGAGGEEESEHEHELHEVWHIGAGGAVTALSTPLGEREEMFTKLKGPLGVFEDQV